MHPVRLWGNARAVKLAKSFAGPIRWVRKIGWAADGDGWRDLFRFGAWCDRWSGDLVLALDVTQVEGTEGETIIERGRKTYDLKRWQFSGSMYYLKARDLGRYDRRPGGSVDWSEVEPRATFVDDLACPRASRIEALLEAYDEEHDTGAEA